MSTDSYSIHVAVDSTSAVTATRNLNGMTQATGRSEQALSGLGGAAKIAGAALAGMSFVSIAKDLVRTVEQVENLSIRLKGLTNSADDYAKVQDYLVDVSNRHHKSNLVLADSFSRLLTLEQAGLITRKQSMAILEGISNASSKTGATTEQLKQSMFGLSQAMGTGVVHMEELNQVTEPMPGLLNKIAEAAGFTVGEFRKLVGEGRITSEVFGRVMVGAFASYQGAAEAAGETLTAKYADIGNSWTALAKAVEAPVVNTLSPILDLIASQVHALAQDLRELNDFYNTIKTSAGYSVGGAPDNGQPVDLAGREKPQAQPDAAKASAAAIRAEIEATEASTKAKKDKTAANKEAAAATKALAEAEATFKAQQDATIATSEVAGKLLEGQSKTQLLALSNERKAIEDKAKLSASTATEQATKNAITQQTQDALFASLDKTRAIEAAIIAQSAATIDIKIAAAQAELDTADKYNLTLAEQLKLKSEIAGLQAEKALIPEQMSQLDMKTQGSKDEIVSNAAAERIKAISEAQTAANERATAEMLILTANLDAARDAATGLADAFGAVGGSIGDMGIAFASYEKSQAAITDGLEQQLFSIEKMNDGKGDQAKKDKAIADAGAKQDKLQVKSYGDMTKAAQGFFEKGSTGYKALGVATKVFRAFEMAQSAMSMVKMITDNAKMVGAFISGIF